METPEITAEKSPTGRVARLALPVPLYRTFDYSFAADQPEPVVGGRVAVRFSNRPLVGICVELDPEDAYEKPSPLSQAVDEQPLLDAHQLALATWLADYYHQPLGEVLSVMLPVEARRGAPAQIAREAAWQISPDTATEVAQAVEADDPKRLKLNRAPKQFALLKALMSHGALRRPAIAELGYSTAVLKSLAASPWVSETIWEPAEQARVFEADLTLTSEQASALAEIQASAGQFTAFLLDGVTGSGKTEVYLQAMRQALQADGQGLLLVPEIGLTPQTVQRVQSRFDDVVVLHSAMNDAERWQAWLRCVAGHAKVLIGTRSAVFAAFSNLALIIVDEEHDPSFKQQDGLRYSARDFAIIRARRENIPIVLGSATPSLESLNNVQQGRYRILKLRQRPGNAQLPKLNLLDVRGHDMHDGVSPQLAHIMRRHLGEGGQVLAFINRRGFAPTLVCGGCGWIATCTDCDVRMTLHTKPDHLRCHHCGAPAAAPAHCPDCRETELVPVGQGTQRAEQGLAARFADVPITRIDRDTTRTTRQLNERLDAIQSGEPMILVGTQMLAKGHHFPNVTLVAVLGADGGFFSSDFRAPERMAQTIMQVAGRAGRAEREGEVWIQTFQPEHPLLKRLVDEGYDSFAAHELEARKAAQMPPQRPMALIRADATNASEGAAYLVQLKQRIKGVEAYGPAPAPIQRISNRFRYQLMLLAENRNALRRALMAIRDDTPPRNVRWSIDVDPYDSF